MTKNLSVGSEITSSESSNQNSDQIEKQAKKICKKYVDKVATLGEIMKACGSKFAGDTVKKVLKSCKGFSVYNGLWGDKAITWVKYVEGGSNEQISAKEGTKLTWEEMKEMANNIDKRLRRLEKEVLE